MPPRFKVPEQNRTHARAMRRNMTDAELKLWHELRAHRLMGLSFRRQYPIGYYIVDFACPSKRLIVELDGSQHSEDAAIEYDRQRTRALEAHGWTVLRFFNHDILRDVDGVCQHIITATGLAAPQTAMTTPFATEEHTS
jgi:very-short-patch-repair endonuclease